MPHRRRLVVLLTVAAFAVIALAGTASATTVSAGEATSCAAAPDGSASCWGYRSGGQLGDAAPFAGYSMTYDPVRPVGLDAGVSALTQTGQGGGAGNHSCAIVGGAAKCWGNGANGQLGDGGGANRNVPVQVLGLESGVTEIDTNAVKTCAIVNATAKCWGTITNSFTGAPNNEPILTPRDIPGGAGALHIATGWRHACMVIANGTVKCAGDDTNAQLGGGTPNVGGTPSKIVAGIDWNCALVGGGVKCWGNGDQLGYGSKDDSAAPVTPVGLGSGVTDIDGNWEHACAIKTDGTAWCWGERANGRLGDNNPPPNGYGGSQLTPVQVYGLSNVTAIATGARHTCALTNGSERWCWGSNQHGALGNEAAGGQVGVPVRTLGSTPKPPVVPVAPRPPVTVTPKPKPAPKPAPVVAAKPTITFSTKVKRVGRTRTVAIATLACPKTATRACAVSAPRTITIRIKRKSYTLAVTAPRSVRAGRKASVTVKLSRSARTALAGRTATVRATLRLGTTRTTITQKITA